MILAMYWDVSDCTCFSLYRYPIFPSAFVERYILWLLQYHCCVFMHVYFFPLDLFIYQCPYITPLFLLWFCNNSSCLLDLVLSVEASTSVPQLFFYPLQLFFYPVLYPLVGRLMQLQSWRLFISYFGDFLES